MQDELKSTKRHPFFSILARGMYEEQSGKQLQPGECVHHINGKYDDNRLENLQIMTRSEHARLHGLERAELFSEVGRANKGKCHSEETRKKVGHPNNQHFAGHKHTEEAKQKISEALTGIKRTEQHRQQISAAKTRYWAEWRKQNAK